MENFWVIDTKCKLLPESAMPQDGSAYYLGRSVVPASNEDEAVVKLTEYLKSNSILLEKIIVAVIYDEKLWDSDDEFDVHESYEEAKDSGEVELGCFISEKSMGER